MTRPPGSSDVEWLDLGPPEPGEPAPQSPHDRPGGRRWSTRWIAAAVLAAVITIAGIVVVALDHGDRPAARTGAPATRAASTAPTTEASGPSTADAGPSSVFTASGPSGTGQPEVTIIGHPLLGVTDRWELFLRGSSALVRVELAAGRVTVTGTPAVEVGGGIQFVLTRTQAFVLPADLVPGFVVPDGGRARGLAPVLTAGGPLLPGPSDGEFWQQDQSSDLTATLVLVDATGRSLGRTIALPATISGPIVADGSGYVIAQGVSGSYDARPDGLRRISTGPVIAVGPTAWLAEECDDVGRCSNVVVDKATWQRKVVGPTTNPAVIQPGLVSPDGSRAAITRPSPNRRLAIDVLEIATGAEHTVADIPDAVFGDAVMAWSPDGRWLFVVGNGGLLQVIDAHTFQHLDLGVRLPPAVQVAVRPAVR